MNYANEAHFHFGSLLLWIIVFVLAISADDTITDTTELEGRVLLLEQRIAACSCSEPVKFKGEK